MPHLFTFWTADNYVTTGCRNSTCRGFVQYPGAPIAPGMPLGPISVIGGQQFSIELTYLHFAGRWWLYYGASENNVVGFYLDTLFGDGPLAQNSSFIEFGGETTGTVSFPPMGSGRFANEGWQRAAYQRAIGYYPPEGGAIVNANLALEIDWPTWYTGQVNLYSSPWLETLWHGGPGGRDPAGPVIVPHVIQEFAPTAANIIIDAGLVPEFSGPNGTRSWVFSQSPRPERIVPRGSTVHMVLRDDPLP